MLKKGLFKAGVVKSEFGETPIYLRSGEIIDTQNSVSFYQTGGVKANAYHVVDDREIHTNQNNTSRIRFDDGTEVEMPLVDNTVTFFPGQKITVGIAGDVNQTSRWRLKILINDTTNKYQIYGSSFFTGALSYKFRKKPWVNMLVWWITISLIGAAIWPTSSYKSGLEEFISDTLIYFCGLVFLFVPFVIPAIRRSRVHENMRMQKEALSQLVSHPDFRRKEVVVTAGVC